MGFPSHMKSRVNLGVSCSLVSDFKGAAVRIFEELIALRSMPARDGLVARQRFKTEVATMADAAQWNTA